MADWLPIIGMVFTSVGLAHVKLYGWAVVSIAVGVVLAWDLGARHRR